MRSLWAWVRVRWLRLGMIVLSVIVLVLVVVVLVLGNDSQRLDLASELVAGLVAGLVVGSAGLVWERRYEARSADEVRQRRSTVLRTITEYVGVELSPLGAELQLVGVDEKGGEIELFESLDVALNAYKSASAVERMMREVGRRRSRGEIQVELIRTLTRVVPGFYGRLEQHIDVFLDYFMASGDHRAVGALLDLWDHRSRIPQPPDVVRLDVADVLAMVERRGSPRISQQRAYLSGVVRLLLWYSELLRALDGIESGIPGRRTKT